MNGFTWRWILGGLAAAFLAVQLTFLGLMISLEHRVAVLEADHVTHSEHEVLQRDVYTLNNSHEITDVRREIDKLQDDIKQRNQALENWERDEKAYDAEIRSRVDQIDNKFAARIDSVDARLTQFLNSLSERLANIAANQQRDRDYPPQRTKGYPP